MIINLTAPEVHPPQQIILRTDSDGVQRASLWGVSIDGEPLAYLGGWDDKRGVTVMYDDVYLSVDYAWYLSWAFRDIAEEAARIEASLAADCYDPRDAVEPRSVLDHDDYAEFDCIE